MVQLWQRVVGVWQNANLAGRKNAANSRFSGKVKASLCFYAAVFILGLALSFGASYLVAQTQTSVFVGGNLPSSAQAEGPSISGNVVAIVNNPPTTTTECTVTGPQWNWGYSVSGGPMGNGAGANVSLSPSSGTPSVNITASFSRPGTYYISGAATATYTSNCRQPDNTYKTTYPSWSGTFGFGVNVSPKPKHWYPTPSPITGGRMLKPQNQTASPVTPAEIEVLPGTTLPCEVEGASDSDRWIQGTYPGAPEGNDSDNVSYVWSATGGTISGSGTTATWTAPQSVTAQNNTFTIKCTIDDQPKAIAAGETGSRGDDALVSSVTVKVVPKTWNTGLPIGKKKITNADGTTSTVDDGNITSPVPTTGTNGEAVPPRVMPNSTVNCAIESATDLDEWTGPKDASGNPTQGEEADEIIADGNNLPPGAKAGYTWTCSAGYFRVQQTDPATGQTTLSSATTVTTQNPTWVAPNIPDNADGTPNCAAPVTVTLTCKVEDRSKPIVSPETGERDDAAALTRTVQVIVDPCKEPRPTPTPTPEPTATPEPTPTPTETPTPTPTPIVIVPTPTPTATPTPTPVPEPTPTPVPTATPTATPTPPQPCGDWSHKEWVSHGVITWDTTGADPQPSITNATERQSWSDPCAGTTENDKDVNKSYSKVSDTVTLSSGDGKWYRHVTYRAKAITGSPENDSVVSGSHVMPRHWSAAPDISGGTVLKPEGAQKTVAPGSSVLCEVAEAFDKDTWKVTGAGSNGSGQESESVSYSWKSNYGTGVEGFSTLSGKTTTWSAPTAEGTYTLTCTIDDPWTGDQTGVSAPDLKTRNDKPLEKTITVRVTTEPSSAEFKLYQDKNGNGVIENNESVSGTIGGSVYVALEITLGSGQRLASNSAVVRVKEEHEADEVHTETASKFDVNLSFDGDSGWQKKDANGNWVSTQETPRSQNNSGEDQYFRKLFGWRTTDYPLGHNESHSIKVFSVDGDTSKTQVEFAAGGNAPYAAGPNATSADVQNLIVTNVQGSGNPHYIKFDPVNDDATLKNPTIKFTVEDQGRKSNDRYQWWVWIRETNQSGWYNYATMSGIMNQAGEKTVTINAPDTSAGDTQDNPLTGWGTYAFDIHVAKMNEHNTLGDWQGIRSTKISMPLVMPAPITDEDGNPLPGHYTDFENGDAQCVIKASYYLESNKNASEVTIVAIDPNLGTLQNKTGPTQSHEPHFDIEVATLDESSLDGKYITVFTATDSHGESYRNHTNHPMLAVNQKKPWSAPLASNYQWYTEPDEQGKAQLFTKYHLDQIAANIQKKVADTKNQQLKPGYWAKAMGTSTRIGLLRQLKKDRIMFVWAHGLRIPPGGMIFDKDGGDDAIAGHRSSVSSSYPDIRYIEDFSTNANLVVYMGCYTSRDSGHGFGNLLVETNKIGAKATVGFENYLDTNAYYKLPIFGYEAYSREWGTYFWESLCHGKRSGMFSSLDYTPASLGDALTYAAERVKTYSSDGKYHGYDSAEKLVKGGGTIKLVPVR